ncbi:MAG: PHB depolymerase family esterase [Bacteroidota bacterium]
MKNIKRSLLFFATIILFIQTNNLTAQQMVQSAAIEQKVAVKYYLYLPEGYENSQEQFPLLLFLHGGGESGDSLQLVLKHGIPKLIAAGKKFPFIVLSPQNPGKKKFWDDVVVNELLDKIIATHKVDKNRIYATGMSRGAYGTWRLAMQHPDKFAAIAPVCGAVPASYAMWIKHIPTWVFHGAKDPVIAVSESADIVEHINRLGGDAKLTVYSDAGHNAWTATYNNPELYEWLLSHTKEKIRE